MLYFIIIVIFWLVIGLLIKVNLDLQLEINRLEDKVLDMLDESDEINRELKSKTTLLYQARESRDSWKSKYEEFKK